MSLKQKPFTRTLLDEEQEEGTEVITIRLNEEERKILDDFKKEIDQASDGTALKLGFLTGVNVIQHTFSGPIKVRLLKKRYSKHDPKKPKQEEV